MPNMKKARLKDKLSNIDNQKIIDYFLNLGWGIVQWGHYALIRQKNERGFFTDGLTIPMYPSHSMYEANMITTLKEMERITGESFETLLERYQIKV